MSVIGNDNAAKGKRWRDSIAKRIEAMQVMDKLAEALIVEAMTGNIAALKEIGDRLDGKSKQQIDLGGQEDNPVISEIKVRLVKAGDGISS